MYLFMNNLLLLQDYNSPGSPGASGSDHEKEKNPEDEKITLSKKEV